MGPNYFSQLIKTSNLHTYTQTHGNQTAEIKKKKKMKKSSSKKKMTDNIQGKIETLMSDFSLEIIRTGKA